MKQENRRYVRFTIQGPVLSPEDAKRAAYEAVFGLWGEAGASGAHLQLVEYDTKAASGIVSCSRQGLQMVFAAFALKTKFNGSPIAMRPSLVSGTVNHLSPKPRPRPQPRQQHRPKAPSGH